MYGFDGKWEDVIFLTVLALSLGVSDLGMGVFWEYKVVEE